VSQARNQFFWFSPFLVTISVLGQLEFKPLGNGIMGWASVWSALKFEPFLSKLFFWGALV